ncbi:MAG: hypothetical protein JWR61_1413 [Ferruginibacter sp.]|nr:hypothetical protein [Ferruginibacter sp.]
MQTILSPLTGRQVITNSKAIAVNRAAIRLLEGAGINGSNHFCISQCKAVLFQVSTQTQRLHRPSFPVVNLNLLCMLHTRQVIPLSHNV